MQCKGSTLGQAAEPLSHNLSRACNTPVQSGVPAPTDPEQMGMNKVLSPDCWRHLVKKLDGGGRQGSYLPSKFSHIGGKGNGAGQVISDRHETPNSL